MVTVRAFTSYQLNWLKQLISWFSVEKLAVIEETGDLIVEYLMDGERKTIKITREKEIEADNAIYEIITPKQLK